MKTKIYFDGMEGFAKRAKEHAKALDEGKEIEPSKSITFESVSDMSRLLTEGRISILKVVKGHHFPIQELASKLKRDIRSVSKDVDKLEEYGIVRSERRTNPGHGVIKVVSAPANIVFTAEI